MVFNVGKTSLVRETERAHACERAICWVNTGFQQYFRYRPVF